MQKNDADIIAALAEHLKEDPECAKVDVIETDIEGLLTDALRENIYTRRS